MEDKKFVWCLRILGGLSVIFGYMGIEAANEAGLAGAAVLLFSLPFFILPILISLLLRGWKRLIIFILLALALPFILSVFPIRLSEEVIEWIVLILWLSLYFYLRLADKIISLKNTVLFLFVPAVILFVFLFLHEKNIYETDEIIGELDTTVNKCIQKQEQYGAELKMLPKLCDVKYEVTVSKPVCKYIAEINFDNLSYEKGKRWSFVNGNRVLMASKMKSITINGLPADKNLCKSKNEIIFNAEPSFDHRAPYDPVKKDKVEYTTYKGQFMTVSEWADIVWDNIYHSGSKKETQKHNEKELNRLKNKKDNSVEVYTIQLD